MVPAWFFPIAIAAGNTVVLKPSEKDPSAALWLAQLWKEAGLPDGVFTVLNGDKDAVDGLLEHPDVAVDQLRRLDPDRAGTSTRPAPENGKRVQALGGAKNHMLVLPDADLDLVADQARQRRLSVQPVSAAWPISVVLAVEPVADELITKISERMPAAGRGRPATRLPDMGPLVTREAPRQGRLATSTSPRRTAPRSSSTAARSAVEGTKTDSAWSHTDRRAPDRRPAPTPRRSSARSSSVVRVQSFEDGVDLINSGEFGNGTAIFTNDGGAARRFQNEVQVGMIGINVPIPVPVATFTSAAGRTRCSATPRRYGADGFDFFTR